VKWELLAFDNSDKFSEEIGNQQYYFVLTVDLVAVEKVKKEKKAPTFCMLGSAPTGSARTTTTRATSSLPSPFGPHFLAALLLLHLERRQQNDLRSQNTSSLRMIDHCGARYLICTVIISHMGRNLDFITLPWPATYSRVALS
jgi:hypothetical protein